MLKAIFGFLGVMIALAIVSSLAKTQLGGLGQIGQIGKIGQTTTRVHTPSSSESPNTTSSMSGRAVGGARLDAFAATAGAEIASGQQPAHGAQKSVVGRTDDAWRQSEQRYKRADP